MVSRERLKAQGLWAYETGRLRAAVRVALVLIPAAAVCLLESRGRGTCACVAFMLLGLAIWLRWKDRRGMQAVTTGLLAGSAPLVAGLTLDRLDLQCGLAGGAASCTGFAILLGGAAGVFIAFRESKGRTRLWSATTAAGIAALAASLGCLRLGIVGLASVLAGIVIGTLAGAVTTRRA